MAMVLNSQTFNNSDNTLFIIRDEFDHGFFSIIPTLDYYWQKNNFHPYLGFGLGPYSLANYIDVARISNNNSFEVETGYQLGALVRGGFELGKGRFGLEYNFVPKSDIESTDRQSIGIVNSSYWGISAGFVFGGWNNSKEL